MVLILMLERTEDCSGLLASQPGLLGKVPGNWRFALMKVSHVELVLETGLLVEMQTTKAALLVYFSISLLFKDLSPLFCLSVLSCLSVHHLCALLVEIRRGCGILWNWSYSWL